MQNMDMFSLMFFGVWALVGSIFLLVTLVLYRIRKNKEETCTQTAAAEVVEVIYHHTQKGGAYYPVLEFMANGKMQRVESSWGGGRSRYEKGQRMTVCYDPANPRRFRIEGDNSSVVLEKIFLLVGLGCILVASVVGYILS